jgi:multisubunit Na+/H+ antiporter MnhF subunit
VEALGGAGVNEFLLAGTVMLAGFVPVGVVCLRGGPIDALAALELAGALATTILLCLAEGFGRPSYFDVPVVCAVVTWVSGLVFARFLGRHI